jgi:hypothetical protein
MFGASGGAVRQRYAFRKDPCFDRGGKRAPIGALICMDPRARAIRGQPDDMTTAVSQDPAVQSVDLAQMRPGSADRFDKQRIVLARHLLDDRTEFGNMALQQ